MPLLLLVVGNTSSASILLIRTPVDLPGVAGPAVAATLAIVFVTVCFSEMVVFWLSTGSIMALDILFFGSKKERRIIELSALSFWPQAVWGAIGVALAWLFFHPEAPNVNERMTTIQLREAMVEYQAYVESTDFMLTYRLISAFAAAAVVALQCCILRVVSGFTVGGAWAAGSILGLVLVVIPWAFQRFW